MIYVSRKAFFCAAHRYYDDTLSPERNRERFGACVNTHGHNYELEITVAGNPDEKTGMVINLTALDAIIKKNVIDLLDHKNLNTDIEEFKSVIPTTEMIARFIWCRLDNLIVGAKLHCVRLHEDPTLFVDYFGENG